MNLITVGKPVGNVVNIGGTGSTEERAKDEVTYIYERWTQTYCRAGKYLCLILGLNRFERYEYKC